MYEEYKYSNHLKKIILVIMILFIPIAIAVGLINYNVLKTPAGDSFAAGVVTLVPGLFCASFTAACYGFYREYRDRKTEQAQLVTTSEQTP